MTAPLKVKYTVYQYEMLSHIQGIKTESVPLYYRLCCLHTWAVSDEFTVCNPHAAEGLRGFMSGQIEKHSCHIIHGVLSDLVTQSSNASYTNYLIGGLV